VVTSSLTRLRLAALGLAFGVVSIGQNALAAMDDKPKPKAEGKTQEKIQEPAEEDTSAIPKQYVLNPLQAEKELTTGNFYFKKGNFKAAAHRFEEATRWNPAYGEAWVRLGDARLRQKDKKAARDAYSKYLEVEPEGKEAEAVKKKLAGKL
jgi:tetratricopeptide (TPR) repeat protein